MTNLSIQMGQIRNQKLLRNMAVVIKQLREEQEQSQATVYGQTNVHIGRIESATANPTVSTIAVLCEHFNISQSDFYKRIEALK
jgi:hypothetical protein